MIRENPAPATTVNQAIRFAQVTSLHTVSVVCMGDSLTGYNNFGPHWPLPTYPDFLQEILVHKGQSKVVANGEQAGASSCIARALTEEYLTKCANATHFIIAFGTNDLSHIGSRSVERSSENIIVNLAAAFSLVRSTGKRVACFNVPHLNSRRFGKSTVEHSRHHREYHNSRLAAYCRSENVSLADVCQLLKDEHFDDGLHPNAAGARIIAEAVYPLIM